MRGGCLVPLLKCYMLFCRETRKFPKHTHRGGEEFLVLEGTFKDQFGEFPAGTYVRNPIDSSHAPWVDEDGCTIMVKLLQMADTVDERTAPLHINLDRAKVESGKSTENGTVVDLYANDQTGEVVEMWWLNAEAALTIDEQCAGGEELFIMDGSLHLGIDSYRRWGWLRFPVTGDSRRLGLRAGSKGAQVFRKTGHLTEKALSMEKIQIHDDDTVAVI